MIKRAQKVFNAWIRERDKDKGCITCGGRVKNAGHYYHAHVAPSVRFNEVNVNGQCINCNFRKAGASEEYRRQLIKRYGEDKVRQLDIAAKQKKKWSKFELQQIIKLYAGDSKTIRKRKEAT